MIKKIILHIWNSRDQFIRYFVIGFSAFLLDIGSFILFTDYLKFDPVLSVVINQIFIIAYVFLLNKFWSFKAKGGAYKQVVRFFMVMVFNYVVAIVWMWFWHKHFGFNDKLVRIINIILATSWNFLLYKHFVYDFSPVDKKEL